LNNNNYRDIITKNYNKVLIENVELKREKVLADCYTNTLSTTDVTNAKTKANGYGHDIMYSKDNKEENRSYGITTHHNTVGSATKFHAVLYTGIDYISNIDHADDYDIADIKVNYYFKYISPLIPFAKIKDLADTNKNKRYGDSYGYNYTLYETNIHSLKNDSQPDTIIKNYKDNPLASYNAYYMIDNLRIGLFNTTTEDDYNDADYKTNLNQILKLFSYIKPTSATTAATATVLDARNIILNKVFKERYEVLLNVLIYFCINEINYWNTYTSKKIYDNENSSNYEYINDVIYPDYEKHTILLNLIKYLKDQKANSEKITKDAMLSTTTVTNLKNNLIREIIAYSRYKKDSQKDKKPFFGKEYNILSNITEIKDNFTADISYGSANTFYEQYFNISNNDTNAYDVEYKIGNYFIKNIKYLLYFIILIIIIAILLIIFLYRNEKESLMTFSYDIMMPLLILLIFVIYIYIFMNFNTNYNLNVIYGLFDSSYKRDLNDMNNLIIPFIKLHSNSKDKYDNNYYDLYIITNVMASFLYSDDEYDKPKYKNIYHKKKEDKPDIIYSKDETVDYNEFKKYYNDQFTIINEEFKEDFATINADATNDYNLKKLYNNIKTNIKNKEVQYTIADIQAPGGFDDDEFVSSFKTYSSEKIVNIILICLELFGNNKDAYKKSAFVKNNFYFEKDKNGDLIPHKFRFREAVFDKSYTFDEKGLNVTIKDTAAADEEGTKIYISKGDKKDKITEIANNYMNILSLFQYNYILSDEYSSISDQNKKKILESAADNRGFGKSSQNYLHQYKNKRLISLISNTKSFDKSFDKKSFVLATDTFKYFKSKDTTATPATAATPATPATAATTATPATPATPATAATAATPATPATAATPATPATPATVADVMYVYTNIIETYSIKVSNISDNYLENVVKTICYQVDNRDVVMNERGGTSNGGTNIKNKNGDAHDNQVNILHKANQCISYDFATNYTTNLIMLGIIYSIGLYNNKIF
jgi:hypothetical protein